MYKFRLESLLNHRRFLEESLQRELAVAEMHLHTIEKDLEMLTTREQHAAVDLKQRQQTTMNSYEFTLRQTYIELLSKEIEKQQRKVCEAQFKVGTIRNNLIEAVKKRETLEKLKEKGLEAYRRKLSKNEQDNINEAAMIRYYHNHFEKRQ